MKKRSIRLIGAVTAAAVVMSSFVLSAYAVSPEPPSGAMGTPPDGNSGQNGQHGPGGQAQAPASYSAVIEYSKDTTVSGKSYSSTGKDESAILVSGGNAVIDKATITRKNDSSTGGDSASFYGVGAAVLATDGTAYIDNSKITTDSKGGAGVFAYGNGTVYIGNTAISTTQDTSGGIHAAGGGKVYAWDLDVTTKGGSSAAVRSDRGGGTMVVDGGSYTTSGTGSPAVYCTADIAVNNAKLTAKNSEGVCIEGLNKLYLFDSDLTSTMPKTKQNENLVWGIIVYQSMSGDAKVGNSELYIDGGSVTCNGDILYTTNTESHITLNNVKLTSTADNYAVLRATGNANGRGWGKTGANGADCTFTAISQKLDGNVIYDSISNLDLYLTDGSVLTGAMLDDETNAGNGGNGKANVYIDSKSKWIVTADSTCTNLYNAGTIVDTSGKTVTIKNSSGKILVKGKSSVTVTVSGTYKTSADISGATKATSFSEFAVTKPSYISTSASASTTLLETTTLTVRNTGGKFKFSWKAVSGAEKYQIYYSEDGKTYKRLGNVAGTKTSASTSKLDTSKSYKFIIRSYKTVNGKKIYSKFSKAVNAVTVSETNSSAKTNDSAAAYDTSSKYTAAVLKNGDSIVGGTYTATGNDESVIEASGNVTAVVRGAVLKKISGNASSADASSFRGVNSGVRVYGTLTRTRLQKSEKSMPRAAAVPARSSS